jgi:hypothetical protein
VPLLVSELINHETFRIAYVTCIAWASLTFFLRFPPAHTGLIMIAIQILSGVRKSLQTVAAGSHDVKKRFFGESSKSGE